MDLMPTLLEVAGGDYPMTYEGREIAPLQCLSLMSLLEAESSIEFATREIGWEAYGMDAYRRGSWKLLRLPEPYGNWSWQLYNLSNDPGETDDVAADHPDLVNDLARAWELFARQTGVIRPSEPVAYARPVAPGRY